MRLLVTADLHFSDNPRDQYRHEFVDWLVEQCKRQVDALLILGDLTEEKDNHGAWLVNKVVGHVKRLARECDVVFLQGNHDWVTPESPFYEFVKWMPGVQWVRAPTDLGKLSERLPHSLLLPHTGDYKKAWVGLDMEGYDLIFAHHTFIGANMGFGHMAETGVPLEALPAHARIISGDIHVPQKLGNVTYVGAPYTVDFGDDYAGRVLLLEGPKLKTTSIPYNGPQKRLIEIAKVSELDQVSVGESDVVKVRVNVDTNVAADLERVRQEVRDWGERQGVWIYTVQFVRAPGVAKIVKREATARHSDSQLLRDYAKLANADDRVTKVGLRLMEEK